MLCGPLGRGAPGPGAGARCGCGRLLGPVPVPLLAGRWPAGGPCGPLPLPPAQGRPGPPPPFLWPRCCRGLVWSSFILAGRPSCLAHLLPGRALWRRPMGFLLFRGVFLPRINSVSTPYQLRLSFCNNLIPCRLQFFIARVEKYIYLCTRNSIITKSITQNPKLS